MRRHNLLVEEIRVVVFKLKLPRLPVGGSECTVIPLGRSSTPGSRHIGRDTVVTFAEEPTIDTYHIEIVGEDKIKEYLAKPCN